MFTKMSLPKRIILLLSIAPLINNAFSNLTFPVNFQFGVATASYQIEGGWNAGGKAENIWDRFTHTYPNLIKDHSNGDVACDSYNKWREDVRLLKDLGVNFYRFSLSWSRIMPTGFTNVVNKDGVKYYNDLIDELLRNGIEPLVTLYHWDLPQPLQDLGGWANPVLVDYFKDYARLAFGLFGDRVKTWITFNEPPEICMETYASNYALIVSSSGIGDYLCGHTLILAHANVYRMYEKFFKSTQKGKVGITVNCRWFEPKSSSKADIEATERAMQMQCGWWLHPIYAKEGDYPAVMIERIGNISRAENFQRSRLPAFTTKEVKFVQGSFDFLGLNHYTSALTSEREHPIQEPVSHEKDVGVKFEQDPKWKPSTATWLKVVPWGFRKLLNWIKDQYDNPLTIITENGYADDGTLEDQDRIDYHREYLKALLEALQIDGCNVNGYAVWSLMDNMEWRDGYTLKFGLCQVDFNSPNRTRTPKKSFNYYKQVIENKSSENLDTNKTENYEDSRDEVC